MLAKSIYHAAYHCNNMQETVDFYTNVVGLNYLAALRADHDPVTGEPCDFIHTFFLLEDGSAMAFFEVAGENPQLDDPILQHFAMVVADRAALDEARKRLEDHGVDFVGPVDHKATLSIYFRDPTGHQLEFALPLESEVRKIQADGKWDTLKRWNGDHHPGLVGAE
jgi:catechol 2,3-dioxygenase-like lactoylglutathione lyase family enzyme